MVEAEIALLQAQRQAAGAGGDRALPAAIVPDPDTIDEFDRAQLAAVIGDGRDCASLSAAGRRHFATSRSEKSSRNEADRLRKYRARFDLDRAAISA